MTLLLSPPGPKGKFKTTKADTTNHLSGCRFQVWQMHFAGQLAQLGFMISPSQAGSHVCLPTFLSCELCPKYNGFS